MQDADPHAATAQRARAQQRQVLRARKDSDIDIYGNAHQDDREIDAREASAGDPDVDADEDTNGNAPHSSRNYQNRKWSMEESVSVNETNIAQWTSSPHTITCALLLMGYIIYAAFHDPWVADPGMSDSEVYLQGLKRGIKFACVFFLTYCVLQLPDGHYIRPHPIFWRFVTGLFILYEMLLVVLLFLRPADARAFLKIFDPALGVELPEISYASDCRLYTPENPESRFINVKNTFFDQFVIAHFVGWIFGALMVRSTLVCWLQSIMFEWYEISFAHWLPNFHECWWDHVIFDIFTCNAFGIYIGMRLCRWLEMKKFNWVGIHRVPNLTDRAKRTLAQFTPAYWLKYDWMILRSANRFWRVMIMVLMLSVMQVNSFFLKTVLWVPASHSLNLWRLGVWSFAGCYAVSEYYIFTTFTVHYPGKGSEPVKKLGPRAWLAFLVVLTEICVIVKHGQGMFTEPFPWFVKVGWAVLLALIVFGSSIYFAFIRPHITKSKSKTKKTQ